MGKLRRISEKMALCSLTVEKSAKSILLGIEILDIFIDLTEREKKFLEKSWSSVMFLFRMGSTITSKRMTITAVSTTSASSM